MRYEGVLSDVTAHKLILSPTAYMNISRLGIGHYQVLLILFIAGRVEVYFFWGGGGGVHIVFRGNRGG